MLKWKRVLFLNILYATSVITIGAIISFVINIFLIKKYVEYSLSDKSIILSMILSVFFSIVITFKLNSNDYFYELDTYIKILSCVMSGIMTGTLASSFVIDVLFKELPDENNVLIGLCVFLLSVNQLGFNTIWSSTILFVIFFTVSILSGQFGMGDVKMMFFMGLGFLPYKIMDFLFITFTLASMCSIVMMILLKSTKKDVLPFGPFLIIGFLSVIL